MAVTRSVPTRILSFPAGQSPAGGMLDDLQLPAHDGRTDLIMDYRQLQLTSPPEIYQVGGKPWEKVQGIYYPRRLLFIDVQMIEGIDLFTNFGYLDLRGSHLSSALAWRAPDGHIYYLFGIRDDAHPFLLFIANRCLDGQRAGPPQEVTLDRDWSPAPASPARLVPNPQKLRQSYGGDPVAIYLKGRPFRRRLFIGGVDIQGDQRPDVDIVLNVGEEPSRWATTGKLPASDRWDNKGEGSSGMDADEMASEAGWVIERLQAGQRVLVHCAAGMNRSATICCAVLILLEGLTAEAALERVRESHPWARPGSHHWLALRFLSAR